MIKTITIFLQILLFCSYSLAQEVEKKEEPVKTRRVFGSLSAWTNSDIKFDNVGFNSPDGNLSGASLSYDIKNLYGLILGYSESTENLLGFDVELLYIPKVDTSSYTLEYKGVSAGGASTSSGAKLSIYLPEFLLNYKINNFLLLFGFNYSLMNYTADSSSKAKNTIDGGIGLSLGSKYFLNEVFALDIFYRAINVHLRTEESGTVLDSGTGYLKGLSIGVSYFFN